MYFRPSLVALASLLVVASLGALSPTYAQWGFDYGRFPPIRHSVPFHRQETMVWCWVASAKMVSEYYNRRTPSQCRMLEDVYGAPCCSAPDMCARGGYIAEIQNLIHRFGGRTSHVSPPGDGFALYATLRRAPIVLHTRQGQGHFVVATGMRVVPTQFGPLGVVSVNDPFFGVYDVEFPRLLQAWNAALVVH